MDVRVRRRGTSSFRIGFAIAVFRLVSGVWEL